MSYPSNLKTLISTIIISFLSLSSQGFSADTLNQDYAVGRDHRLYFDENRSSWINEGYRPLSTIIWYPTSNEAVQKEWQVDIFKHGKNAEGAEVLKLSTKLPLIVLSHGTGGSANHFSWFAEKLVSNGFIVAAVNHHGNTAAEEKYLPQGFSLWWERPQDISALIDNLLKDPVFGELIDREKIAAGGFSLGGYTSIALAGGQIDFRSYGMFCDEHPQNAICVMPPESSFTLEDTRAAISSDPELIKSYENAGNYYGDPRLKAIYSMAPVMGPAFSKESLEKISIPVKVIVGTHDDQAIPKYNAEIIAAGISNSKLKILPDVTHYTFLSRCTKQGLEYASQICKDIEGIDRAKIHDLIANDAIEFYYSILN